jgi:hypothetical protein
MELAARTAQSISFLVGAQEDGFVTGIEAALRADSYELQVYL